MKRAWQATCPEGPMMDAFATSIEQRINTEVEPPFSCQVELVDDFVKRCDGIFQKHFADNSNVTREDIESLASTIDLGDFYDLVTDDE